MKFVGYLLLFAVAAYSGLLLRDAPGDLLLVWQDWSIALPMWLAITGLLSAMLCILTSMRLLYALFSSIDNGKRYFRRAKIKTARQYTTQALLQLAEGQWQSAEKNASKGALFSELPFLNYVSAAKAAQEQQAWDRRDHYLALAAEHVPSARIAAGIIKAKLQYKQGELAKSLVTLQDLRQVSPRHPLILRLLADLYVDHKNWPSLLQILPLLKRKNCLPEQYTDYSIKAYQGLLLKAMQEQGKQGVVQAWRDVPRQVRLLTAVVATYVECLGKLLAYKEAYEALRVALKKNWDPTLVKMYGRIYSADLAKQIYIAENWLQDHPGDPVLLLSLARLCVQHKLWGKARDYLQLSLQLDPTPESYAELGDLLGKLGEASKSLDCYRKGLLAVTAPSAAGMLLE